MEKVKKWMCGMYQNNGTLNVVHSTDQKGKEKT